MARRKYISFIRLLPILVITLGLVASVAAVKNFVLKKSEAHDSQVAGSLGGRTFYRTAFATETGPVYALAMRTTKAAYWNNKTFVAYVGSTSDYNGDGGTYSAYEPLIMQYDHVTDTWSGPVKIFSGRNASGGVNWWQDTDNHRYGAILADNSGYLHVLYTFHGGGHNIVYAKSKYPGNITQWDIKEIPNTGGSSYGAAFLDAQGEMYLFFRHNRGEFLNGVNVGSCSPNGTSCKWYEPEVYVKSSNGGLNWSAPVLVIDPGLPANPSGYGTAYTWEGRQDFAKNRLYVLFSPTCRGCGDLEFTDQRAFYFNFSDDTVRTLDGVSYGTTLDYKEYSNREFAVSGGEYTDPKPSTSGVFVLDGTYPHIYYVAVSNDKNPSTGNSRVGRMWRATWNNTTKVWNKSEVYSGAWTSDPFSDVVGITEGEYRAAYGTDLYVKVNTFPGSTMFPTPTYTAGCPAGYSYLKQTRVFNSNLNWASTALFTDHPTWEVRGMAGLFLLRGNSNPEARAVIVVPKYTSTQCYPGPGPDDFIKNWPIGAHYLLGEARLANFNPTSTSASCPALACNSWTTMNIRTDRRANMTVGGCSAADYATSPRPDKCKSNSDYVWLDNTDPGAVKVRYFNLADVTIFCASVSSTDPGWSRWEDYSLFRRWKLLAGAGQKKVCVQYKNNCGAVSAQCGAMVEKI